MRGFDGDSTGQLLKGYDSKTLVVTRLAALLILKMT